MAQHGNNLSHKLFIPDILIFKPVRSNTNTFDLKTTEIGLCFSLPFVF